ncbi:hypothetical protein NDU88_004626 [Pleurodeles waltl]|uniref:Uncharacterized protein n=1 Tax=Pleurodeles waltl TaxID=8319 RepID=A0AAV7UG92_PLEWA|nr:hypothetical protein NDU88_004626 [Pleurodeles waltl]
MTILCRCSSKCVAEIRSGEGEDQTIPGSRLSRLVWVGLTGLASPFWLTPISNLGAYAQSTYYNLQQHEQLVLSLSAQGGDDQFDMTL